MTPQVAERLTIHEQDAVESKLQSRGPLALNGLAVARATRRIRLVDGSERSLPWTQRRETLQRRLLAVADVFAAAVAL